MQVRNRIKPLKELLKIKVDKEVLDIVILCIGTDRIIGDSFGPLVGNELKKLINNRTDNVEIIGDLDSPISNIKIDKELEKIYFRHKDPYIIMIDAALGKKDDIGKVIIKRKGVKYGSVFNNKKIIGDISILGIVGKNYNNSFCNFNILQNVSLNMVMKMAEETAIEIYQYLK